MKASLDEIGSVLASRLATMLQQKRESTVWMDNHLRVFSPLRRLQGERQRLDEMGRRWDAAQVHSLQFAMEKFNGMENRLLALSPVAVLRRGYAVITKNEKVVTRISQIQLNDGLQVRIQDGEFNARVTGKE
jgi:exodeoxyribonuclease VII large subunit